MEQTFNLFGWNKKNGADETALLMKLMRMSGFRVVALIEHSQTALLTGPNEYGHKMLSITDNGGELNVEWVNAPESLGSIAATYFGENVSAYTMHQRIIWHLDGVAIDYTYEAESFDLDGIVA
ncbi:MAG: hypothetical protein ACOVN2_08715 [Usitatibacteraceae bacterium]